MPSTNQNIPANTTLTPAQKEEMSMLGMTEQQYIAANQAEHEEFERLLTLMAGRPIKVTYGNPQKSK